MGIVRMLVVCVICLALAGCQGSPAEISMRSEEQLRTTTLHELSVAYGSWGQPKRIRAELERRNAFTPQEWAMIDEGRIRVGSSRELVLAARGDPRYVRRSSSAYGGYREVWIYEQGRDRDYVYLDGIQVTGWSD